MDRKQLRLVGAIGVFMIAGGIASAAERPQTFLTEAIQGDIGEIKLGQLAQQKGESAAVRNYGDTLAKDHAQALEMATQTAQEIGMENLPKQTSAKKQQTFARLSKLSGREFDREFVSDMIDDHQKDIADFQAQAKDGSNEKVAMLAKHTVPTLQKHLQIAQSISK
jgi:putative membrane protein